MLLKTVRLSSLLLFLLCVMNGFSFEPTTLSTPTHRLTSPEAPGNGTCVNYTQLPTAILNDDGTVTVFANDGRRSLSANCNTYETVIAIQYSDAEVRRTPLHTGTPDPYRPSPGVFNHPDCAPREYPVSSYFTNTATSTLAGPRCCGDPPNCTWPDEGAPCGYRFEDRPPDGYCHTTMECAIPSAARLDDGWHVLFTRTNYDSYKCRYASNIVTSSVWTPWVETEPCAQRVRGLIAGLSGDFPFTSYSMIFDGDIPGAPFCAKRGCCIGTGFMSPRIVPKPSNTAEAWVFYYGIFDETLTGNYRLEYVNGRFTQNWSATSGLNLRGYDYAWSFVDGVGNVFYSIAYDNSTFLVYKSDDEGITWTAHEVNGVQVSYACGGGASQGNNYPAWMRNPDGSLAQPLTVFWQRDYDHDNDPATPNLIEIDFQTADISALPQTMLSHIFSDSFEGGDATMWNDVVNVSRYGRATNTTNREPCVSR